MSAAGRPALLTRRGFVQAASGVVAAQAFAPALQALGPLYAALPRLACRAADGGIETLRLQGNAWARAGFVTCEAPSALALHGAGKTLYVAHGTDVFQHLPSGSVGCYRVEPGTGALSLLHRERLSLACTRPNGLAVSPDGKLLIVASGQAGILNLLPLSEEGVPGAVIAARKELQWETLEPTGPGPRGLRVSFIAERTFAVSGAPGQMQTVYRCNEDEIALVDQWPLSAQAALNRNEEILPSSLRTHDQSFLWI